MTNEEAIKHLSEYLDQAGMDVRMTPEDTAAIAMGIEALNYRKSYLAYVDGHIEHKKGKWERVQKQHESEIAGRFYYWTEIQCSCCKNRPIEDTYFSKYCPYCGAEMENADEEATWSM